MLDLPKTTEFNRRIPKQKFYEKMNADANIKKIFAEQVKIIYWKNKITVSTTNLAAGSNVTEVEVFEIRLNSLKVDEKILHQIDKEIPYHILFLLEYQGKYQAWIGYKEISTGNKVSKVKEYFCTEWLDEEKLPLRLEGLNMDAVYDNFVRQVAGERLKSKKTGESLRESIDRDVKRRELQKQIDSLTKKIRKEKQLNRQMEMNSEMKKIKKELETL